MLIVVDYFDIESKGNRAHAIKNMIGKNFNKKDIYEKKK